ncbi:MAG: hypothetical protein ACI9LE_000939 [Paraglaciecola sp.]|jgi:hypothetical protein
MDISNLEHTPMKHKTTDLRTTIPDLCLEQNGYEPK